TCGSCSATSNSVTVTVSPSPSVSISASGSTSLCTGYSSGPTLTSSVSNCSGTAQYQWYQNSVAIVGATSSSYTVPAGLSAGTYTYTLVVTCGSCSATRSGERGAGREGRTGGTRADWKTRAWTGKWGG